MICLKEWTLSNLVPEITRTGDVMILLGSLALITLMLFAASQMFRHASDMYVTKIMYAREKSEIKRLDQERINKQIAIDKKSAEEERLLVEKIVKESPCKTGHDFITYDTIEGNGTRYNERVKEYMPCYRKVTICTVCNISSYKVIEGLLPTRKITDVPAIKLKGNSENE